MARLGVLKPLRGTESSLANVVLDEGEIAFSYPSTGPGTGLGGIKMGDGTSTFSSLPWYITGEGSGPDPGWTYDTGTGEVALLHNIEHCERETIGKTYYIQSYFYNGSSSVITQDVPYHVIGINHEGTTNTVDLQSMVSTNKLVWANGYNSWTYGKYSTSNFYTWLSNTCPNGYSSDIKSKMCYMTERWREATGNDSGTLQTRNTKCKILNPFELSGSSCASLDSSYQDLVNDNYGEHYSSIFTNSIDNDNNRKAYSDLSMSSPATYFTNSYQCMKNTGTSWYGPYASSIGDDGNLGNFLINSSSSTQATINLNVVPVIRLCNNP